MAEPGGESNTTADTTKPKVTDVGPAPPKRDKFASMAAAAKHRETQSDINPPPPKRDKLASMAAAQQTTAKRDKLASMAAVSRQQQSTESANNTTSEPITRDTKQSLERRLKQRDQVLQDLEQAEGWTWQLLTLASTTAQCLADLQEDKKEEISKLSATYRDVLHKIHSTLSPHAHLIVPYQNHQVDVADNKLDVAEEERVHMYAARVEMRLAQEHRNVLKELLRLEQEEKQESFVTTLSAAPTGNLKRKGRDSSLLVDTSS